MKFSDLPPLEEYAIHWKCASGDTMTPHSSMANVCWLLREMEVKRDRWGLYARNIHGELIRVEVKKDGGPLSAEAVWRALSPHRAALEKTG